MGEIPSRDFKLLVFFRISVHFLSQCLSASIQHLSKRRFANVFLFFLLLLVKHNLLGRQLCKFRDQEIFVLLDFEPISRSIFVDFGEVYQGSTSRNPCDVICGLFWLFVQLQHHIAFVEGLVQTRSRASTHGCVGALFPHELLRCI